MLIDSLYQHIYDVKVVAPRSSCKVAPMNTTTAPAPAAMDTLSEAYSALELKRKVQEDFLPTALGGEFVEASLLVYPNGEFFTLRAATGFTLTGRGVGGADRRVKRGETVTFNRAMEAVR